MYSEEEERKHRACIAIEIIQKETFVGEKHSVRYRRIFYVYVCGGSHASEGRFRPQL